MHVDPRLRAPAQQPPPPENPTAIMSHPLCPPRRHPTAGGRIPGDPRPRAAAQRPVQRDARAAGHLEEPCTEELLLAPGGGSHVAGGEHLRWLGVCVAQAGRCTLSATPHGSKTCEQRRSGDVRWHTAGCAPCATMWYCLLLCPCGFPRRLIRPRHARCRHSAVLGLTRTIAGHMCRSCGVPARVSLLLEAGVARVTGRYPLNRCETAREQLGTSARVAGRTAVGGPWQWQLSACCAGVALAPPFSRSDWQTPISLGLDRRRHTTVATLAPCTQALASAFVPMSCFVWYVTCHA